MKGEPDQVLFPFTPLHCPDLCPHRRWPFGGVLEAVSHPSEDFYGYPLGFRSGCFSHPFSLLHTCILNPDRSISSHDETSTLQDALLPLRKRTPSPKATSSAGILSSVYFRRETSSSVALLRCHSLMDASSPTDPTSSNSHILFTEIPLWSLRPSSGLFPSRRSHFAETVGRSTGPLVDRGPLEPQPSFVILSYT